MKRILVILLVLLVLVGCNQTELTEGTTVIKSAAELPVQETTEAETAENTVVTVIGDKADEPAVDYQFAQGDITIKPTEKYELIQSELTTPVETGEAPSCAFEGVDTVYVFDGYEIQCGLIKGEEIITGVFVTDEKTETPEGLSIGMSIDDMVKIYGSDFTEDFGKYTYEGENVELIIVGENEKVLTISYIGKFN